MKKVVKKRVLCGALAATMAASLALPALADQDPGTSVVSESDKSNVNIVAAVKGQSDIDVTIFPAGGIILNPYGLEVLVPDALGNKSPESSSVISAPYALKNNSNTDLDVSVTIKTTKSDTYSLLDNPGDEPNDVAKNTDDERQAFLFVQFIDRMKAGSRNELAASTDIPYSNEDEPGSTKWLNVSKLIKNDSSSTDTNAVKFYNNTNEYNQDETDNDHKNDYSKTCVLNNDTTGDDGYTYAQVAKLEHSGTSKTAVSTVWYKVMGLTNNPAKSGEQWSSSDTLTTNMTFRFGKNVNDAVHTNDPMETASLSAYYSSKDNIFVPFTMPTDLHVGMDKDDITFDRLAIRGDATYTKHAQTGSGNSAVDIVNTISDGAASNPTTLVKFSDKYGTQLEIDKKVFSGRQPGDVVSLTLAYSYYNDNSIKQKNGVSYKFVVPSWDETTTTLYDYVDISATGAISNSQTLGVILPGLPAVNTNYKQLTSGASPTYAIPGINDATNYRNIAAVTANPNANPPVAEVIGHIDYAFSAVNKLQLKDDTNEDSANGDGHSYLSKALKSDGDTITYYVPVTYQTLQDATEQYKVYAVNVKALQTADNPLAITLASSALPIDQTQDYTTGSSKLAVPDDIGNVTAAPTVSGIEVYDVRGKAKIDDTTAIPDTAVTVAADGGVTIDKTESKGLAILKELNADDTPYVIIRGTVTWTGAGGAAGTTKVQTFEVKFTLP